MALLAALVLLTSSAYALNGDTLRLNTFNGWKAFELISEGDNPGGDGVNFGMMNKFDGAGAYKVDDDSFLEPVPIC